jgi:hypothetical protein
MTYTYPIDPANIARDRLRGLIQRAQTATNHDQSLRIAFVGDSTWTSPGGFGVFGMHKFNRKLGLLFGNIAGSQLIPLFTNSGTPYVRAAGNGVAAAPLDATHDAPGMGTRGVVFTGESVYGADITFQPFSQLNAATRHILAGSSLFPTADQRLEIFTAKRDNSAESLRIQYRPTDKAFSVFESQIGSDEVIDVPGLAENVTNYELIRVRTNAYSPTVGKPYPQWWIRSGVATTSGVGSVAPPLVVGARVLNASPVGPIIDTFSAGGYRTRQWFGDTSSGGGASKVNAAAQMVQFRHDVWCFNLGTNDYYADETAANQRRNYYDPDGTNNRGLIGRLIQECETRSIPVPLIIITIAPFRANDGNVNYAARKAQHELAITELKGLVDELQADGYDAIFRDVLTETKRLGFDSLIEENIGTTPRGAYDTGSVSYAVDDTYQGLDGRTYRCIVAHTSSTSTEPTDDGLNNTAIFHRPHRLHLVDPVHWSEQGAEVVSESIANLFAEHYAFDSVQLSAGSISQIVQAINADATQTTARTNAATAATQSTTAATQATTAATQATTAATEIGKVPRLSTAIAAGAAARRNKVAATADTLDETLGAVP